MTFYLLIIRSTHQRSILNTRIDYQYCLRMIKRLEHENGVVIKAYCLMPGYVKLVAGFQSNERMEDIALLDEKADWMVWKYLKCLFPRNATFQSQCIRISSPHRISELAQYIECEPVRAGIVQEARQYRYSSAYV